MATSATTPSNVWFLVELPDYDWDEIPLTNDITNIIGLKRAINNQLELVKEADMARVKLKATRKDTGIETAINVDAKHTLESVLKTLSVEVPDGANVQQLFAANIWVYVVIPTDLAPSTSSAVSSDNILKRRMEGDPQYASKSKKIRIEENWGDYKASDGNSTPKDFGRYGVEGLLVTEQMLGIWNEVEFGVPDDNAPYRRVLSGPMGVGKTYLAYFLAARGYAEGWLTLYIADTDILKEEKDWMSADALLKRFFALNKDVLTASELESLVANYDGDSHVSIEGALAVFDLLKQKARQTLLVVDEHGRLFQDLPYVPVKFKFLNHLSSLTRWSDDYKGSRVIFTGTAQAKFEMNILEESVRKSSMCYVGPLSKTVFSKLLEEFPRLNQPVIADEVTMLTNSIPRELVYLWRYIQGEDLISIDTIDTYAAARMHEFHHLAWNYFLQLRPESKIMFCNALLKTFVDDTSVGDDFEWNFIDLGLIYQDIKDLRNMNGIQFEAAMLIRLVTSPKPITLQATDLAGNNPTTILLDFKHHGTIKKSKDSLGFGHGGC
ncbi:hypothetical protein BGX27_009283 [Mortierella sp. AM989]|nr:hypothetical protein BGX27_009283 [Mortierella sp. AM989]